MYQLSAPRLNKEGSLAVFLLSLDEQIEESFGGIVKKQRRAEELASSLKQYLNNRQDVVMDDPVFFLACQRHPYTMLVYCKSTCRDFMKRREHEVISYPFEDPCYVKIKKISYILYVLECLVCCAIVFEKEQTREKEILLTLVYSCLVIDLHGPLVVTLRAMQQAYGGRGGGGVQERDHLI